MEFKEALEYGNRVEKAILNKYVLKNYPDAVLLQGYNKKGDIYSEKHNRYFEVKADLKSQYTNNVVIEIQFNGKPSALMTTESYYWIFYLGTEIIIITPDKIWEAVIQSKTPLVTFIGNGDTVSKKAFLIKKHELIKFAKAYLNNVRLDIF